MRFLWAGAVGEVGESRLAELVLLQLPEIAAGLSPGSISDGPVVVFALMGFAGGLPCEWHWMQTSLARTESSRAGLTMLARVGVRDVRAAGPVALLAADVPFGRLFVWML